MTIVLNNLIKLIKHFFLIYICMSRNKRTKKFREDIQEEYVIYLVEIYNKYVEDRDKIKKILYEKFEYFYDNDKIIEILENVGLINWGNFIYQGINYDISNHPNLSLEWIKKFFIKDLNWYEISKHKNFCFSWLEKYPDWNWNWSIISMNKRLQLDFLIKYPDWPWDWEEISINENLSLEWLKQFPDKGWIWGDCGISINKNLQLEWLIQYPNKDWDWKYIYDYSKIYK